MSNAGLVGAQTAPSSAIPVDDEPIVLNVFEVATSQDKGYRPGNSVSATRIETPIKDLPFSVTAYTEQFINDIDAHELRDVVRYAPGVSSNAREFGQGNSTFSVRGFDTNPQRNGFIGPSGNGFGYIDAATLQRVEVVKGPATLLYGQLPVGGMVNFITKRPLTKDALTLSAQYGSYDYYRGQVDANVATADKKLLTRVNIAAENDYQYIDYHKGKTLLIAPVLQWIIDDKTSVVVDYQWFRRRENAQAFMIPNIRVPLTTASLYPDSANPRSSRFPVDYYGPLAPIDKKANISEPNDFRYTWYETTAIELDRSFGEHWKTRGIFVYDYGHNKTRQHGFGDATTTIPNSLLAGLSTDPTVYLQQIPQFIDLNRDGLYSLRRIQYSMGRNWNRSTQLDATGKYEVGGTKLKPLLGFSYNRFSTWTHTRSLPSSQFAPAWNLLDRSTWTFSDTPNEAIPVAANNPVVSSGTNTGAYTTLQVQTLDDRLLAVAGVRWSKAVNDASPTAPRFAVEKTTPQIGASYRIFRELNLYTSYSESFQSNGRLLRVQSNVATLPAKPFLGKGYEVGFKSELMEGRISGTLAYFNARQENYIFSFNQIDPNTGLTVATDYQNGNVVKSDGVELELVLSPTNQWQVYLAASSLDPRFESVGASGLNYLHGRQPESSAKKIANVWTRYNFAEGVVKGLWVAGGFNYTGKKAMISNNPNLFWPDRTVWDAVIGYDWKWLRKNMSASLAYKNFTNTDDTPAVRTRGQPARVLFSVTARL